MNKNILTAEATRTHSMRIVGYNIDAIVHEAMRYVFRNRDFYEKRIVEELESSGRASISRHSGATGSAIFIYYDPERKISLHDMNELEGREFYIKYEKP